MGAVIGIDAGGTKTLALLADETGAVRARARRGGANLHLQGEEVVEQTLREVLAELAPEDGVAALCVGMAGVDRPEERDAVEGMLRRLGVSAPVRVVNDATIALLAGAPEGYGIVVISGTGSISYGVDPAGHTARSGGWGELLGDEGSAVWIGRVALRKSVRGVDGRGPRTSLASKIARALGLEMPAGLLSWVQDENTTFRERIATLLPMIQEAVEEGDRVAFEVVDEAAEHLTRSARAVANQLELPASFPVVLAGGAFRGCPSLVERFTAKLELPRARVARLDDEPATGAVRLALALLKAGASK
ncbi:MAG TPA: BadF/BadG/BcrA/BcrD ATPase family protein [Thermoanaerobaculia bacterium]|nr:BadF/BadG/BcrA/BcrD ATPase family protein [Thermoanaerobaculia bacterium]